MLESFDVDGRRERPRRGNASRFPVVALGTTLGSSAYQEVYIHLSHNRLNQHRDSTT